LQQMIETTAMPSHMPSELGAIVYCPEGECYGFYVVAKIDSEGFGPRAKLVMMFKRLGIPLLSFTGHFKDFVAYDFAIVNLRDSKYGVDDVRVKIMELFGDRLLHLEAVHSGVPGLVYNVYDFPLLVSLGSEKMRAAALCFMGWNCFFSALYNKWAPAHGIYHMVGKELGEAHGRKMNEQLPCHSVKEKMNATLYALQAQGWGRFRIFSFRSSSLSIRINENFECMSTKNIPGYKSSFISGFLVGLTNELIGKTFKCEESRCIKTGHSICQFDLALQKDPVLMGNKQGISGYA